MINIEPNEANTCLLFSIKVIVSNILMLSEICLSQDVPVLLLGVPNTSIYKEQPEASQRRIEVNKMLKEKTKNEKKIAFLECPIEFDDKNLKYFDPDTVHFSKEGYKYLGQLLAEPLKAFLAINV